MAVDLLDPTQSSVYNINADEATTTTLNLTSGGKLGQQLLIQVEPDEAGTLVVTFGTYFRATGTASVAGGKAMNILFHSDGIDFVETCRTSAVV